MTKIVTNVISSTYIFLRQTPRELSFDELPAEVIHQVKRLVLDILGVGFGGYLSEPSQVIQSLVKQVNGPAEATVFVSGLRTSCLYATLANGAMVRYLDYIHSCYLTKEGSGRDSQNSVRDGVGRWQASWVDPATNGKRPGRCWKL